MKNMPRRLLFQGDSITDCGRSRDSLVPHDASGLGSGYVSLVSRQLGGGVPCRFDLFNRGVSGNRISDIYARWKPDALHLKPDVISILVGVNDTWHEFRNGNGVEVRRYAQLYRMLLEWTREVLPSVRFALCEPFVLPCGVVGAGWREEIDGRRAVVAQLASQFDATLVPFQSMFDAALCEIPAIDLAADGVHPTETGHRLMAKCWLDATGISTSD